MVVKSKFDIAILQYDIDAREEFDCCYAPAQLDGWSLIHGCKRREEWTKVAAENHLGNKQG